MEKRLFFEAAFWMMLSSAFTRILPFRAYRPILGKKDAETDPDEDAPVVATSISWAVEAGGRHLFWKPRCLSRVLASRIMLKIRGIDSTVYFGARPGKGSQFKLHAWLRCGDRVIAGGSERRKFKQICSYA